MFYGEIIECIDQWRPEVETCKSEVIVETVRIASALTTAVIPEFPELSNAMKKILAEQVYIYL